MKYFLSTAGKKCCKGCTWLLSLARNEEGYDLIQLKRGLSEHKHLMKLYPGEPAIILDTGEFYIGDAEGRPILINPDGAAMPVTGSILCIRNQSDWTQGSTVTVDYADMITSDYKPVGYSDIGRYGCAVIIDDTSIPIGVAFTQDWQVTDSSASFLIGYFVPEPMQEFTENDIDLIISHAKGNLSI